MPIQKCNIIGAGGFGKEVRSILPLTNYQFAGFIDDDTSKAGVKYCIADFAVINTPQTAALAIGSSKVRYQIFTRLPASCTFPSLVHPLALLQDQSSIEYGRGTIICAGSILTCDISIGEFALINLNCTIGHDVTIGDFCSLMPAVNLSGNVRLEDEVFIGTAATVLPGLTIGKGAIIGAGAVVTHDVAAGTTVKGVPARPV